MPVIAAVIGGVATMGASALASRSAASSAEAANRTNVNLNRENRDWQERMANTQHQREMADLRAAGLNPILSGTGGAGAAVPSSSAAQVMAEPGLDFGDPIGKAASAYQAARADRLLDQQEKLLKEQVSQAEAQASSADSDAKIKQIEVGREAIRQQFELGQLKGDDLDLPLVKRLEAEYGQPGASLQLSGQELENKKQELRLLLQQYGIGQSAEAKARVEEEINKSSPGQIMIWLEHVRRAIPLPFFK